MQWIPLHKQHLELQPNQKSSSKMRITAIVTAGSPMITSWRPNFKISSLITPTLVLHSTTLPAAPKSIVDLDLISSSSSRAMPSCADPLTACQKRVAVCCHGTSQSSSACIKVRRYLFLLASLARTYWAIRFLVDHVSRMSERRYSKSVGNLASGPRRGIVPAMLYVETC